MHLYHLPLLLIIMLLAQLSSTTRAFFLRSSSSLMASSSSSSSRHLQRQQQHHRLYATTTGGGAGAKGVKRVLVPVADGSEEIESVTIIDVLVRAGAKVTVASVMPNLQVKKRIREDHVRHYIVSASLMMMMMYVSMCIHVYR